MLVSGCYYSESISDAEANKIAFDVYKEISSAEKSKHKLLHAKLSKSKTTVSKKDAKALQS